MTDNNEMMNSYPNEGVGSGSSNNVSDDDMSESKKLLKTDTTNDKYNKRTVRDIIAFWFFGLCNNFGYVIMLSAADDIISMIESTPETNVTTHQPQWNGTVSPFNLSSTPDTGQTFHCNRISTGAVLLADILPGFLVKLIAPLFITLIPYWIRILCCVLLSATSFILVAFSTTLSISIFGVTLASLSSGLGELSFLGMTSFYSSNTVASWSSGTGAAGVFGSLSYAGLRSVGLTAKTTLLINLIVPIIETAVYIALNIQPTDTVNTDVKTSNRPVMDSAVVKPRLMWKDKIHILKNSLTLMIPLLLVYVAEYVINQGLFEILYFDNISVNFISSYSSQYRWYQVLYQVGVMASRSSVNIYHVKHTWIFTVLQFINLTVLLCQVLYQFIPYIWIVFILILWEGLMGGASYVNTFYQVTVEELNDKRREFTMTLVTVSDSAGILIAAFIAMSIHNAICSYLHYF